MNPDGSGVARLTNNAAYDAQPAWSPDGSKIAFVSNRDGNEEIYSMNAAGTGQTRLTNNSTTDRNPTWSPDGGKIAFASGDANISSMNADGSGQVAVTNDPNPRTADSDPAWSSTGKIALSRYWTQDDPSSGGFTEYVDLFTVDPDGSNVTQVTHMPGHPATCGDLCTNQQATQPAWSPDGAKLAFTFTQYARHSDPYLEIYVIAPDGTGQTALTQTSGFPPPVAHNGPAWSPDGTKIAFTLIDYQQSSTRSIWTMNADGTAATALTQPVYPVSDADPDWQTIPNGYPRPKGATPLRVSLVPAYQPCASANSAHGSPLAFPSCNPPLQASGHLTVGTPPQDPVNSVGYVTAKVIFGDVQLDVSITDVRNQGSLSDYGGELESRLPLRVTDKDGGVAATTQDLPFSFAVPCAATANTSVGSTCSVATTADTLMPGAVTTGLRAIWALGQTGVYDGGSDGNASTTADNTLFMDQGIFVP